MRWLFIQTGLNILRSAHVVKQIIAGVLSSLMLFACSNNTQVTSGANSTMHVPPNDSLRVATWNMEHFTDRLTEGCRPRSKEDIAAINAYLTRVGADVYALQEVASVTALRQVFPADDWQIVFSGRPDSAPYECRENGQPSTQQKVAIVARKSLNIIASDNLTSFGLNEPGLRYGVVATLQTSTGTFNIVSLHLKSGCFVNDYTASHTKACPLLARQVPVLTSLLQQYQAEGTPFVIMGDFNHRLAEPGNRLFAELTGSINTGFELVTNTLVGCHPRYPAPIDHILVGGMTGEPVNLVARVHAFDNMNEPDMLSDHCAVSVDLQGTE